MLLDILLLAPLLIGVPILSIIFIDLFVDLLNSIPNIKNKK
tara:strand:+ start:1392 stop:1514 length:123 start_codon:yes stop_codon:yes gene_type:complete